MMYENVFKENRTHHYAAYWSSSDDGDESTWFCNFDDGTQDTAHVGRDMAEYAVFAVRAFSLNSARTPSSDFKRDGTTLTRYTGNGGSVTIPASVTEIGEAAFIVIPGGNSPTSVTIPSSVTAIGDWAFQNCAYMTSVIFRSPSSLTTIGEYAFLGCSSLTSIDIPSSVTLIDNEAFAECNSLTSVTMSGETYSKPNAFPEHVQIHYRD
jgi:hypothetical protein